MSRLSPCGDGGPSWNRRGTNQTLLSRLPARHTPPSRSLNKLINFLGSPSHSPRVASFCRDPRPETAQIPPAAGAPLKPSGEVVVEEEKEQAGSSPALSVITTAVIIRPSEAAGIESTGRSLGSRLSLDVSRSVQIQDLQVSINIFWDAANQSYGQESRPETQDIDKA